MDIGPQRLGDLYDRATFRWYLTLVANLVLKAQITFDMVQLDRSASESVRGDHVTRKTNARIGHPNLAAAPRPPWFHRAPCNGSGLRMGASENFVNKLTPRRER